MRRSGESGTGVRSARGGGVGGDGGEVKLESASVRRPNRAVEIGNDMVNQVQLVLTEQRAVGFAPGD